MASNREMYLDWVNNFLTVEKFAEHYGITETAAEQLIETERSKDRLMSYAPKQILEADSKLFLHAFEDYDGVLTKHRNDMSSQELAEAASEDHRTILLKFLSA